MFRDPLYRQIRERLGELSDGDAFEACACDLLRGLFPTLVPIEGGNDAGMDGAVVQQDAPPIVLICTTDDDVIGNLTRSLDSYLSKSGRSRTAILATSRELTPERKRNLEARAAEKGFFLQPPFDQAAFANLLHGNQKWRKELLGLTGNPPALSLVPLNHRPFIELPLIGRQDELQAILNGTSDLVLSGQPGSGKTHLLFTVASQAEGLFVVDDDATRIANDLRDQQPKLVILDDAQTRLQLLRKLRQLRRDVGADFMLIAVCWPGAEDAVTSELTESRAVTVRLDLLPPQQIRDVIHAMKIGGPRELVQEIIDQAAGKPGLAVTLCHLCWHVGVRDVVLGNALCKDVRRSFEALVGVEAIPVLACFAVGGYAGMSVECVSQFLRKSSPEVLRIAEQLAAGGILEQTREHRLSVYPLRLRQALVRDVFFGSVRLDASDLLADSPDFDGTTRTLIGAKALGGDVPDAVLRSRIEEARSRQVVLDEYASLGRAESEWALNNYPDEVRHLASVTLDRVPEKTLDLLLSAATTCPTKPDVGSYEPLREVAEWVHRAHPDNPEAFLRRKLLMDRLLPWFANNHNLDVAIAACELGLSPKHEESFQPPGEPNTFTMRHGVIGETQLSEVFKLWPKALPILKQAEPKHGAGIGNLLHYWVYPSAQCSNIDKSYEAVCQRYARQMMADLMSAHAGQWSLLQHLTRYAHELGMVDAIKTDPVVAILYPDFGLSDWNEVRKNSEIAASRLVQKWLSEPPETVAVRLVQIEKEAQAGDVSQETLVPFVCERLAKNTTQPKAWLTALWRADGHAGLIQPFLERLIEEKDPDAERFLELALASQSLRALAVLLLLKHFTPSSKLCATAIEEAPKYRLLVGGAVLRGEVRNENLRPLLQHTESAVAVETATRLWGQHRKQEIPGEVFECWKDVIVRLVDDDYSLASIAERYPELANEWLRFRIGRNADNTKLQWLHVRREGDFKNILATQNPTQRQELINQLAQADSREVVRLLVGEGLDLFQQLLKREDLGNLRLAPLEGGDKLSQAWQKMALAAMDSGFSPESVYKASEPFPSGWSGPYSRFCAERLAPFEQLAKHTDARLAEVGRIGAAHYSQERSRALAEERRAVARGHLI